LLLAGGAGVYFGLIKPPREDAARKTAIANEQNSDPDGDGLSNLIETQNRTDPDNPDSDQDGLSDGEEIDRYGTKPKNPDTDGDEWMDGFEVLEKKCSDPFDRDTDNDGLIDSQDPDPCKVPTVMPSHTPTDPPTPTPPFTRTPTPTFTPTLEPTITLTPLPAVTSSIEFRIVTGGDGTQDNLVLELSGNFENSPFRQTLVPPNGLRPDATEVFHFDVPLDYCSITGYTLRKPQAGGQDDPFDLREVYLLVNGEMVFFDRAAADFSPVTANSFPINGNWSGTQAYKDRCN
jgi:hypothetical protein